MAEFRVKSDRSFVSACAKFEGIPESSFVQMVTKPQITSVIDQAFAYLNESRRGYKLPAIDYRDSQNPAELYIEGATTLRNFILEYFTPGSDPLSKITWRLGNPLHTLARSKQIELPIVQELAKIEQVTIGEFTGQIQEYQGESLVTKAMSYLNRKRIKLGLDPIKNTDKAVNLVELYQVGYAEWERHEQKRNRLILCKRWDVPVESSETPESVTRKLNDWLDTNGETISELDLIYPPLTWLPPEIWKLTNLKKIDLEGHRLISLPSEIGKLTKLEKLNLLSNELKELPEELCQLTNLKELYLAENSLTRLPEGIGQLKNLEWLDLSNNKLNELPEGLCQLINLTRLLLRHNSLTRLPEGIGQLKNLEWLNISDNKLSELPGGLCQLINLKSLLLGRNSLTRLPEGIGQLEKLDWLDLPYNELSELPGGIGQLKKLTSLDLSSNQFNIWPLKMLKITNPLHRTVQLRGNPIHDRLLMTRKALAQLFRAALIMTNVVMVTLLITRLIPRSQEE